MSPPAPDPHRVLPAICGAMAASVGVAGAVAWFLAPSFAADPPGWPVLWALVAAAISCLIAGTVVERVLTERAATAAAEARRPAAARAVVVGFAMRESCGLLGAVLTLLTGDRIFVVMLGSLALLAMALAWPSRGDDITRPR